MKASIKITKIGNSAGVVLPEKLQAQMDMAEQIMRDDRRVLRALAK